MVTAETKLRVRYAETDQMGYVYYGNYAQYYEIGRVELLRDLGISYRELEAGGLMLPVLTLSIKYNKPAVYDDMLTIVTVIPELPDMRITFHYKIVNENGVLLNEAETTHVLTSKITKRPCRVPEFLREKMKPFFS